MFGLRFRDRGVVAFTCFVMLLISGKFGGPMGVMKLAFCEYPFAQVTSTGLGEPESEFDVWLKARADKHAKDKVTLLKVYSVLGLILYLGSVGLAVYFINRRNQDTLYLVLILVLAVIFAWVAIGERNVRFQNSNYDPAIPDVALPEEQRQFNA
jgi:uncharacterized membrane protein YbhN (UPF0104 family)